VNTKLYIGNLSPEVTEDALRVLFSQSGCVTEVKLMLDPTTGRSRGFAFVTMATPELAEAALKDHHCCNIGGRHITVTEARPPQEPKGMMSEGFDLGAATPFRPGTTRDQNRRHSPRSSNRRGRGR
jgi:RNA recognition motif-containing protein